MVTTAAALLLLSSCAGPDAADDNSLTLTYSNAVLQVEKIPQHMAMEKMRRAGLNVEETFNQNGDAAIQAVARGDADFGTAGASTVFAAIGAGIPIEAVMVTNRPTYVLVAPVEVAGPDAMSGVTLGTHSEVSSTSLYIKRVFEQYPGVTPDVLAVPNSASRMQAMIAGQLDSAMVQLADWLRMQKLAPGRFHIVYNVAQQDSEMFDAVSFARTDTIENRPDYVRKFVDATNAQYAAAESDRQALADAIAASVPDTSPEAARAYADLYVESSIWPVDGGMTASSIKTTLEALESSGLLTGDALPTADECCAADFVVGGGS